MVVVMPDSGLASFEFMKFLTSNVCRYWTTTLEMYVN